MSDSRRPRILLIDDDPNVREILPHVLASFGYDCETAADGATGLVRFNAAGWDLALVDIVMPEMTGWGVVEAIRRRAPAMPIVLITALSEPAAVRRASDWRLPVVAKPFRSDTVRAAVAASLQTKLA